MEILIPKQVGSIKELDSRLVIPGTRLISMKNYNNELTLRIIQIYTLDKKIAMLFDEKVKEKIEPH